MLMLRPTMRRKHTGNVVAVVKAHCLSDYSVHQAPIPTAPLAHVHCKINRGTLAQWSNDVDLNSWGFGPAPIWAGMRREFYQIGFRSPQSHEFCQTKTKQNENSSQVKLSCPTGHWATLITHLKSIVNFFGCRLCYSGQVFWIANDVILCQFNRQRVGFYGTLWGRQQFQVANLYDNEKETLCKWESLKPLPSPCIIKTNFTQ